MIKLAIRTETWQPCLNENECIFVILNRTLWTKILISGGASFIIGHSDFL